MLSTPNLMVKLIWLILLILGLCHCESTVTEKTILLIGETGVGKSFIGNKLLAERKFNTSGGVNSTTNQTEAYTKRIQLSTDTGLLELTVVDTPGIGDTNGRSSEFLDKIVEYIRTHDINTIAIVVKHDKINEPFRKYLTALKETLVRFNDAQTILIVNKVTPEEQLREDVNGPQTVEELTAQVKSVVFTALNCSSLSNIVIIPLLADAQTWKSAVENISQMIRSSGQVDKEGLKTWTETLKHYENVLNGKISADVAVKWRISQLEGERRGLVNDIDYNQARINKIINIKIPATVLIPIACPITVAVLLAEANRCEERIRGFEKRIREIDNQLHPLRSGAVSTEQEGSWADKKLKYMQSIFDESNDDGAKAKNKKSEL
ncbi:unnamed protein product [Adineta ricciae]|uniref:AIG1-type G domain-containing protein n=1 Tax=Adineta ricciae TaxID=249248 RepID=A0A815QNT1_ADIRI|nr:unnamed protein product [Adineta ricciae]CAF1465721.1 unnamed protein product [Adineta ricciae]